MNKSRYLRLKIVVLSDLRSLPLLTAIFIYRKLKLEGYNVNIVISERVLVSCDFGHYFPGWYKRFKLLIIKLFANILTINKDSGTVLSSEDKLGIFSSLCSITLDSDSNSEKYPYLFSELSKSAMGAKEICNFLNKVDVEEVYLFNGRTASSESIVRFLWDKDIMCKFYEFGVTFGSTYTIFDFPIHNAYKLGLKLVDFYNSGILDNETIQKCGNKYMFSKVNNNYTKRYINKVCKKYDIVIFLGSDHEYSNLNESIYDIKLLGNLELVKHVVTKYGKKNYAVRAHPNQIVDPNWKEVIKPINVFCEENEIDFFDPSSPVSSYSLIQESSLVVVELSSIAIDAIILEKDVDVIGNNDLRAILDTAPMGIRNNKEQLKKYVCEVLSLVEFYSHYQLPFKWKVIKSIVFRIDWLLLKIYKPSLS